MMVWVTAQVEGMQLVIDDLVGSTGLELKVDPGVPYVYAGFAGNPDSASVSWSMCTSQIILETWQKACSRYVIACTGPCSWSARCMCHIWGACCRAIGACACLSPLQCLMQWWRHVQGIYLQQRLPSGLSILAASTCMLFKSTWDYSCLHAMHVTFVRVPCCPVLVMSNSGGNDCRLDDYHAGQLPIAFTDLGTTRRGHASCGGPHQSSHHCFRRGVVHHFGLSSRQRLKPKQR